MGTGVNLITQTLNINGGSIDIHLDGGFVKTYSTNTGTNKYQAVVPVASGLDFGTHTVKITMKTGLIIHIDAFDVMNEAAVVHEYEYGDTGWKDRLTSYNGASITYDAIGNPLTYRDGMSMSWGCGRRLSGMTKNGVTTSYGYNDAGIRTSKESIYTDVEFRLSGDKILQTSTNGYYMDFLYDESGQLYAFTCYGSLYYYIRNGQGDIAGILASNGVLMARYIYDSWGVLLDMTDASGVSIIAGTGHPALMNPFRYRGYYYDQETGFYYCNSRYYDPVTGRWINADGLVQMDIVDANLYVYCRNNPVNFKDPSGTLEYYSMHDQYIAYCNLYWQYYEIGNQAAMDYYLREMYRMAQLGLFQGDYRFGPIWHEAGTDKRAEMPKYEYGNLNPGFSVESFNGYLGAVGTFLEYGDFPKTAGIIGNVSLGLDIGITGYKIYTIWDNPNLMTSQKIAGTGIAGINLAGGIVVGLVASSAGSIVIGAIILISGTIFFSTITDLAFKELGIN